MKQLNPEIVARTAILAEAFRQRDPFRHVVIENFFDEASASRLLSGFPDFERGNARNENGELANKSVVENMRSLGAEYAALDDLIQSQEFLDWLSQVTGIPELLYDPWYFGGGTHENRHGQDLDVHVDFNRHPAEGWHRRLNLIVYLNPEWDPAWGGSLELHSDPRSADDRIIPVPPAFNRAVIFETTESSWHGFPPIQLPEQRRTNTSRRSIALYFYTRERPAEEWADPHSTIYVDRPLPGHFRAGHTLDAEDVETLAILLTRRDMHLQRLYRDLQHQQVQIEAMSRGRLGRLTWMLRGLARRLRGGRHS